MIAQPFPDNLSDFYRAKDFTTEITRHTWCYRLNYPKGCYELVAYQNTDYEEIILSISISVAETYNSNWLRAAVGARVAGWMEKKL